MRVVYNPNLKIREWLESDEAEGLGANDKVVEWAINTYFSKEQLAAHLSDADARAHWATKGFGAAAPGGGGGSGEAAGRGGGQFARAVGGAGRGGGQFARGGGGGAGGPLVGRQLRGSQWRLKA